MLQEKCSAPLFSVTENALPYWLALLRVPRCGPICCQRLLAAFSNITGIFKASVADLATLNLSEAAIHALHRPDWAAIEKDCTWLQSDPAHHILTWQSTHYPPLLREIADPPPVLFVRGNPSALAQLQLAIVGSRNPTPAGVAITEAWVAELVAAHLTITSGLALGIDAAAHRSALNNGGTTIAVMGTGLQHIYPGRHQKLAEAIVDNGGALVSEFLLNTPPKAENFPRRNRLVSGLCVGTLVVEASLQSGSLITARLAGEQGREVFAIPGSIHNPLTRGCHSLIRQGAKLVETVAEILEELPTSPVLPPPQSTVPKPNPATALPAATLDEDHVKLLECVAYESTPWDFLLAQSGKAVAELSVMLLQLELQGWVVSTQGNYMRVKR